MKLSLPPLSWVPQQRRNPMRRARVLFSLTVSGSA
jgi:hypothetical protein